MINLGIFQTSYLVFFCLSCGYPSTSDDAVTLVHKAKSESKYMHVLYLNNKSVKRNDMKLRIEPGMAALTAEQIQAARTEASKQGILLIPLPFFPEGLVIPGRFSSISVLPAKGRPIVLVLARLFGG